MKAVEQYFPVELFIIMLFKLVLTSEMKSVSATIQMKSFMHYFNVELLVFIFQYKVALNFISVEKMQMKAIEQYSYYGQ